MGKDIKHNFTLYYSNSKLLFYQSTTERDYDVSAGPKRQPRESDPAGKHPNAQPRGNYFENVINGCGRTSTADLAWSLICPRGGYRVAVGQCRSRRDWSFIGGGCHEIGPSSGEVAKC